MRLAWFAGVRVVSSSPRTAVATTGDGGVERCGWRVLRTRARACTITCTYSGAASGSSILSVVVLPLAALLFSLSREPLYQAGSTVLITNQDLSSAVLGIDPFVDRPSSERSAQTQADLARTEDVAARTVEAAGSISRLRSSSSRLRPNREPTPT